MRARFLHASQLRLDAPMTGFRDIDDTVRPRLRDATLDAFDRVVDVARSRQVDAVLFSGDLFAGPANGVRAQLAFSRGVERLADHGIAVVAVAGPGDIGDPWFPSVPSWPNGVAMVGFGRQQSVTLRHRGQPLVTIHAVAAGSTVGAASSPTGEGLHVALFGDTLGETDAPVGVGFHHVAHGGSNLRSADRRGDCWVTTPGTAQHLAAHDMADAIGEAEIFTVGSTEVPDEPEQVSVGAVRLVRMTIDVDALVDIDSLHADLEARADELAANSPQPTVVVSADLIGTGSTHRSLQASGERSNELLERLRSRSRSVTPSLWWASLDCVTSSIATEARVIDRVDFSSVLTQLGNELGRPENRSVRDGWLRAFPNDLRALVDDDRSASVRWAEARRIAEAALATSDRGRS